MSNRRVAALVAAFVLLVPYAPARADNQMGYQLLSPQDAAHLPRNRGALGLEVERAQQITDGGLTFDIIRVKQVKPGSAGARAGLRQGDQIIALDGRVFPSLVTFASYIGSAVPGSQMMVDYMPRGTGPQQAQRLTVIVGQAGQMAPPNQQPQNQGMSFGKKLAIGAGAVALLGCYEMGCFSRRSAGQGGQQYTAVPPQ